MKYLRKMGFYPILFSIIALYLTSKLKESYHWDSGIAFFTLGANFVIFLLIISIACLFDFFYLGLMRQKVKGYWVSFLFNSIFIIYIFFHTISIIIFTTIYT